jgi:Zn-dependent M32 family carboxypeptidase
MTITEEYGKLLRISKELTIMMSIGGVLNWDMETKMPPLGVGLKSEQLGWVQKVSHQMLTGKEMGNVINSIVKDKNFDYLDGMRARAVFTEE